MEAPSLRPEWLIPCLIALFSAACARVPPPAILIEPGVKAAAAHVQRDVVADFGRPEDGTERVMDLGWDPDTDDLRIITEWGVRWIDLEDGSHRDVAFTDRMFRATPVITSTGLRVVGLSGSRDVPVLRLDGSRDLMLRGERYELPIAGDVASAAGSEILLPLPRRRSCLLRRWGNAEVRARPRVHIGLHLRSSRQRRRAGNRVDAADARRNGGTDRQL